MAEKLNLTLEERFAELEKAKKIPQISRPKIQRVANHLRNRKRFAKCFSPKLVSMGPIHHGDPNLRLGEQYKLMWAAMYIESTGHTPQILHKRIADNIEELKSLFTTDVFNNFNNASEGFVNLEEKLSWVLFVDGCALLQILEKTKLHKLDKMNVKVDQLALVMHDILLLENQLPYQVLKLLWRGNEYALIEIMKKFLLCHHWATFNSDKRHQQGRKKHDKEEDQPCTVVDVSQDESPAHLLDLQRTIILFDSRPKRENDTKENSCSSMVTCRNIQELRAAGIRLKSSKTRWPRDISFSHHWLVGELTLPEIIMDDTTVATFLNLIAYEMCPDFENDYGICSYVAFLDSLVDHPEDVKALRSHGILLNSLGSDEEVARLLNIMSSDLVPNTVRYSCVRAQIDKHYRNKWKTWIALACHTYFSNPWAFIAFLAAVIALALTFVQTWFAIFPKS